ncbi:unnamed protein product [Bursaphelenchus okinawaensis]|uniref:G-protein coupled receptors family 1 profile domain-containing protein n=1 Tax=Bursaphelenchus okinawaensis TaxID=465554 RepID=A0A811LL03_9BILA|nr:unnamed protein product [Bursaphelenchus okinawaensis]CAG9125013.1 unnamed protein product [Bursaphelenchus okinawaensis]
MSADPFSYAKMTSPSSISTLLSAMDNITTTVAPKASDENSPSATVHQMRLLLTVTHLLLVSLGTINLVVVFVIAVKPYMRSITNVYMVSLCLADFMYLANLVLVAATQLNNKSWPFGQLLCTFYHGTETTGKYASVMFVVLLAADRYCAMCRPSICARYRNYKVALALTCLAWTLAVAASFPLFAIAEVVMLRFRSVENVHKLCIAKWPNSDAARWYITFSSILIFAIPLGLIIFFYYHILNKLRAAVKSNKRMRRSSSSRAPYHRVTRLVLWVVIFHVMCWSPFWTFNLFSSILRLRISTQFDRIVVNVIHLFPYMNCALNPLVYAVNAENFRRAFRSLFCCAQTSNTTIVKDEAQFGPATTARQTLTSAFNNSSERLLSIHSGQTALAQRYGASTMLNGSVFLPHSDTTPLPTPPSKPKEPTVPECDELPPELQDCTKHSSVVRFVNETTEDLVFPIAVNRRVSSVNLSVSKVGDSTATTITHNGLSPRLLPQTRSNLSLNRKMSGSSDEVFM